MPRNKDKKRCGWCGANALMVAYHDSEWGKPVHDDRVLFEFLLLEGAQAGLTWQTVLTRRENYRRAFSGFDPKKVVRYGAKDVKRLLADAGIIRNRLKVASAIKNAKQFLEIQKEFGSFDRYIWQFVGGPSPRRSPARRGEGGKSIDHKINTMKDIPAMTAESDAMSKDLRSRGFSFVGSTICYAFMQAVGMVNDHEMSCFRYHTVLKLSIF